MPEQISSERSVHCTLTKEKGGGGQWVRWLRVSVAGWKRVVVVVVQKSGRQK